MTERTFYDFFYDFDSLMRIHRENLPKSYTIIPTLQIGTTRFTAEDAEEIVNGIKVADKKQLSRISRLKHYLELVLREFQTRTTDYRNWEYYYGYPDSDNDEYFVDSYTIEMGMIPALKRLLGDLDKPVSEFFGIMRPSERMAIQSISRQKGIPMDIAEYGVSPFLGKKPVGGKTRRSLKTTRQQKNSLKTKRLTKRCLSKRR